MMIRVNSLQKGLIILALVFLTIFYIQLTTYLHTVDSTVALQTMKNGRLEKFLKTELTHLVITNGGKNVVRLKGDDKKYDNGNNTEKHPNNVLIDNDVRNSSSNVTFVRKRTNVSMLNNYHKLNISKYRDRFKPFQEINALFQLQQLHNNNQSIQSDGMYETQDNKTVMLNADHLKDTKRPNYCSLWPNELVGPLQVSSTVQIDIPEDILQMIDKGGRFKPFDCQPREKTAIIIPYRDRESNLKVLLSHLHNVLQRQKIAYGIYVIEMAYPAQFNRGLLANVGFLTAQSSSQYSCYIIHDVDLLMTDDRNMYRCGRVPRHLVATSTKYNNSIPYLAYFGGIEAFTPDQFWKVNGFSNLYFGWGGEDDDMVIRIFHSGLHFSRPKRTVGGYVALFHEKDVANPPNPNRISLVKTAASRMDKDGLRSLQYHRFALEFKPLYTWVYIGVQETKLMQKYQGYLGDA